MATICSNYNEFQKALEGFKKTIEAGKNTSDTGIRTESAAEKVFDLLEANPLFGFRENTLLDRMQQLDPKAYGERIQGLKLKFRDLQLGFESQGIHIEIQRAYKEGDQKEREVKESDPKKILNNLLDTLEVDDPNLKETFKALFHASSKEAQQLMTALVNHQPVDVGLCTIEHCMECYRMAELLPKKLGPDLRYSDYQVRREAVTPQFQKLEEKVLVLLKSHLLSNMNNFLNKIQQIDETSKQPKFSTELQQKVTSDLLNSLTLDEVEAIPIQDSIENCMECYQAIWQENSPQSRVLEGKILLLLKRHFIKDIYVFFKEINVQDKNQPKFPIHVQERVTYGVLDLISNDIRNFIYKAQLRDIKFSIEETRDIFLKDIYVTTFNFLNHDLAAHARVYHVLHQPVLAMSWATLAHELKPSGMATLQLAECFDGSELIRNDSIIFSLINQEEFLPLIAPSKNADSWSTKEYYGVKPPAPVEEEPLAATALVTDKNNNDKSTKDFCFKCKNGEEVWAQSFLLPFLKHLKSTDKELHVPFSSEQVTLLLEIASGKVKDLTFISPQFFVLADIASGRVKDLTVTPDDAKQLAALAELLHLEPISKELYEALNRPAPSPSPTLVVHFSEKNIHAGIRSEQLASLEETATRRKKDPTIQDAQDLAALADMLYLESISERFAEALNAAAPPPMMVVYFSDKSGVTSLRESAAKGVGLEDKEGVLTPDAVITCREGSKLYAHSLVLKQKTLEKNQTLSERLAKEGNNLDFSDYSASSVNLLLDYLYTGRLSGNTQDLLELYRLSDELSLKTVKTATIQALNGMLYEDKTRVPKALHYALTQVYKADKVNSELFDYLLNQLSDYSDLNQLQEHERKQLVERCEALKGDPRARLISGICSYMGCGVAQDMKRAHELLESAGSGPDALPLALHMLGCYYRDIMVNEATAGMMFYKAVQKGHFQSALILFSDSLLKPEDFNRDLRELCFAAARQHNTSAQTVIAIMDVHEVLIRSVQKASEDQNHSFLTQIFSQIFRKDKIPLLQKAALLGSYEAKAMLAYYYLNPSDPHEGVQRDYEMAVKYAQEANTVGLPVAKYVLSRCYQYGLGGLQANEENAKIAAALREEAAKRGLDLSVYDEATRNLAPQVPPEADLGFEEEHH